MFTQSGKSTFQQLAECQSVLKATRGELAAVKAERDALASAAGELVKVAKLVSFSQVGALNWREENERKWVLVSEELMNQLDTALAKCYAPKEPAT